MIFIPTCFKNMLHFVELVTGISIFSRKHVVLARHLLPLCCCYNIQNCNHDYYTILIMPTILLGQKYF
jgi:hypothetical protein